VGVDRTADRTAARALVEAYDADFRASMLVAPDAVGSVTALKAALAQVPPASRALADALLIGVGAGLPVPERFREDIEEHGEPLWQAAMLLPRGTPTRGATIDPLYYAAFCKTNPALARLRLLRDVMRDDDTPAHPPPTDASWDAAVVSARLEADPPRLTQAGVMRKDDLRRLVSALGGDQERWLLALEVAQVIGLVRPAAGALHGFPESRPRPIADPAALLESGGCQRAGALLLRVAGPDWIDLTALIEALSVRCPAVLDEPGGDFVGREGRWLRDAAAGLHRLGAIDAQRSVDGVTAVRARTPQRPRPPGFLLTPDRDVLVGPGELPLPEYGRLCRLAPYRDGDVVHRHRLERTGIAADLAAGHEDALAFLGERSRTGVPGPVRDTLRGWSRAAARVSLLTGATVLERDGVFSVHHGPPPADARVLSYDERPVARLVVSGGEVQVPFGADPLAVRALASRLGEPLPTGADAWRWRLAPAPTQDADAVLAAIAAVHDGPVPGELEAAVRAASGAGPVTLTAAVRLTLPAGAGPALLRDRLLRGLLQPAGAAGEAIVHPADLVAVMARLEALGFAVSDPADVARAWATMAHPEA
jgi:hypothetical protein